MDGHLNWSNSKNNSPEKDERPLELQFDFAEEIAEYRGELQRHQEKEARLLEEVKWELESAIGPSGKKNKLRFTLNYLFLLLFCV